MQTTEIPLFPLATVLFPGGPLPLRVFETRYLDMVKRCLREEISFGVVLISEGVDTGVATFHSTGCTARIIDWYQGSDGVLGITALGQQRFKLQESWSQSDGLNLARVQLLPNLKAEALAAEDQRLSEILERVLEKSGSLYAAIDKHYDDANWVSDRLAEILPVSAELKQGLLELEHARERLDMLRPMVEQLRISV